MNDRQPTLLCDEEEKNTFCAFKQLLQRQGYRFFAAPRQPKDVLDTSQNNTEN